MLGCRSADYRRRAGPCRSDSRISVQPRSVPLLIMLDYRPTERKLRGCARPWRAPKARVPSAPCFLASQVANLRVGARFFSGRAGGCFRRVFFGYFLARDERDALVAGLLGGTALSSNRGDLFGGLGCGSVGEAAAIAAGDRCPPVRRAEQGEPCAPEARADEVDEACAGERFAMDPLDMSRSTHRSGKVSKHIGPFLEHVGPQSFSCRVEHHGRAAVLMNVQSNVSCHRCPLWCVGLSSLPTPPSEQDTPCAALRDSASLNPPSPARYPRPPSPPYAWTVLFMLGLGRSCFGEARCGGRWQGWHLQQFRFDWEPPSLPWCVGRPLLPQAAECDPGALEETLGLQGCKHHCGILSIFSHHLFQLLSDEPFQDCVRFPLISLQERRHLF